MIIKTTSVFFILLANFILLAHDVVPHHHHKGLVSVHNSESSGRSNRDEQHEQERNHNTDDHVCILNQSVIVPSNSARYGYFYFDYNKDNYSFYFILFDSSADNSKYSPFIILPFSPLIKSHHPNIVYSSLGLRAPPII